MDFAGVTLFYLSVGMIYFGIMANALIVHIWSAKWKNYFFLFKGPMLQNVEEKFVDNQPL